MSKKILVISRHFWPEYSGLNEMCERLREDGFRVDVLCGQPSDGAGNYMSGYSFHRVRKEKYGKINIYRTFDIRQGIHSNIGIFLNQTVFPFACLFLRKTMIRNRYDAVLVYQSSSVLSCGTGSFIGKHLGIPVYIYAARLWPQSLYSEIDIQNGLLKKFLYRISMDSYIAADKLIVPSERMRKYFIDRLGLTANQVSVISMTPDKRYKESISDDALLEMLAGSFVVSVPGDFGGRLMDDTMIRLAQMIRDEGIRNIRFLIWEKTDITSSLHDKVYRENLNDLFFFCETLSGEDIARYIHVTDIIAAALNSQLVDDYTIPVEMINCLAAGRAMAISGGGLAKELIKDADCGFSCEIDDVETLYGNIIKLYRMTETQRNRLGKNAADYCGLEYNTEYNAQRIRDIISGIGEETKDYSESSIKSISEM